MNRGEMTFLSFFLIFLVHPIAASEAEDPSRINISVMRSSSTPIGSRRFSSEYVRCFCNLAVCISTGYMCKSSGGGCFSELLDQVNQGDYKGIHGCLELLNDRNHRKWCENGSNSSPRTPHRKKIHSKSMVICCYQDMCNHADSPETKILLNDTVLGTDLNENDTRPIENVGAKQDPALYTDSEVWFRAATIAVPICGAVILLALILLAVKLLRTDSSSYQNRNRKLGILSHSYSISSDQKHCEKQSTYHHRNIIHPELFLEGSLGNPVYLKETEDFRQKYVPLLIQDDIRNIEKNCDKKNETNAKLNFMQEFEQCTVTNCDDSVVSEHLLHKKTDIHVGRNTAQENNIDNSRETINKMYNKECIP